MPVDTFLRWRELHQRIDVDGLRLLDLTFDGHRPRTRLERTGILRRLIFVGAEFVIIVVAGYVLERGRGLCIAVSALSETQFGSRLRNFIRLRDFECLEAGERCCAG